MPANYDSDRTPEPTDEMVKAALEHNLQIVQVICFDNDPAFDDQTGVSFLTLTPFLPQAGDKLQLEDGNLCEVRRTYFKVTRQKDQYALMPNVIAVLIEP